MDFETIVSRMTQLGVRFWLEGDQLCTAPVRDQLPADLAVSLAAHENILVTHLRALALRDRRVRQGHLAQAHYNVDRLAAHAVDFDLRTDCWSELDVPWINAKMVEFSQQLDADCDIEAEIRSCFRLPHRLLLSSGRIANALVCETFKELDAQQGSLVVLHNGLSPNWLYHLHQLDFTLQHFPSSADGLFLGDPDLERVAAFLSSQRMDVKLMLVELCGLNRGTFPVSLRVLKQLRTLLAGIPLVLDVTHLLSNALLISQHEPEQLGRDVFDIAADLCDQADVVVASLSRDFALPFGGIIAARDRSLIQRISYRSASTEMVSIVQQKMIGLALRGRAFLAAMVGQRQASLSAFELGLRAGGLPVVTKMSAHSVLLDIGSFPGLPRDSGGAALLAELYLATGIRAALPVNWNDPETLAEDIALVLPLGLGMAAIAETAERIILWYNQEIHWPVLKLDRLDLGDVGLPQSLFLLKNYITSGKSHLDPNRLAHRPNLLLDRSADPLQDPPAVVFPLSEGQKALYYIHHLTPDNFMYTVFLMPPQVDIDLVVQAFALLQARHPLLRTTFFLDGDRPMQRIHASLAVPLQRHYGHFDQSGLLAKIRELGREPMDLENGPLVRLHLLEDTRERRFLLAMFHHLISDGGSWAPLLDDWSWFCGQKSGLLQKPLEPLDPNGYAAYVDWQERMVNSEEGAAHLAFWRERLEPPPPPLPLSTDLPRPAVLGFQGATHHLKLEPEFGVRLKHACMTQRVSLNMYVLAAWLILLGRASRTTDISIGSLNGGRPIEVDPSLVGFFTNVLVYRADLSGNPSLATFMEQVRDTVLNAIDHTDYPFNRVREALSNPHLYQAGMVHQSWSKEDVDSTRRRFGLSLSQVDLASFLATSQTDLGELTLELVELEQGLHIFLKYNIELYTHRRVVDLGRYLTHLLQQMILFPESPIDELEMLDDSARTRILEVFNATFKAYDQAQYSHQRLAVWAQRQPDAPALHYHLDPNPCCSYAQFLDQVAGLAKHLQELGLRPDQLVGVCLERSPELVVALFAIQAAGGAYVPLDPSYPSDRLAYMVADARAELVITQSQFVHHFPSTTTLIILNAKLLGDLAGGQFQERVFHPEQAAYMIYTSGSTGKPKGVVNSHGALINRLIWHQQTFAIAPGQRVLQKTPFSFDVSVWEFFWPLTCGATLVVAAPEMHKDSATLFRLVLERAVQVLHFVPSMLQVFLEEPGLERLTSLRAVICSGEALSLNLQRLFFRHLPGVALHNLYGPTEAAIDVSWWACDAQKELAFVPIGAPIANTALYVVDQRIRLLGVDLPGELCMGGVQLARGYHQRPALTAVRFIPDPFAKEPGQRLYRSGDLTAWMEDGNLRYLGRLDFQVKLRGLRIELGEIEAAINTVAGVRQSLVLACKDPRGDTRLVAYVLAQEDETQLISMIQASLTRALPEYMIPSTFVVLPQFPISPNGKVERRLLPEPSWQSAQGHFVAPRDPLEAQLAQLWGDVLNCPMHEGRCELDVHQSFIELGGHSLSATRLVARIRSELKCSLSLGEFFSHPNIADLATLLRPQVLPSGPATAKPLDNYPRLARGGRGPLSFAQQRLWFIEQLEPGLLAYILSGAALINGALNPDYLRQAFVLLGERHESLRTAFGVENDSPYQFFVQKAEPQWSSADHSQLEPELRQTELLSLARSRASQPFDLSQPPLLRLCLVRWSDQQHVLLFDFHHLIADFWSFGIMLRELGEFYASLCEQRPASLAALAHQYVDFVSWQRQPVQQLLYDQQLHWWSAQLKDAAPVLALPLDLPRPARQSFRGALHAFEIPTTSAQALRKLSRQLSVTPYACLLGALQRLLQIICGQDDILVGMPLANRQQAEIQDLIGFFVNTLVQRTYFDRAIEQEGFARLAVQVHERVQLALAHQDLPFERLVDALDLTRDQSHNPLFQVLFQLLDLPSQQQLGGLQWQHLNFDYHIARFDLALHLFSSGPDLHGWFEYNTDLFLPQTIARITDLFLHLLMQMLNHPEQPLASLDSVPEDQRQLMLQAWQDPGSYPQEDDLYALFLAQARQQPQACALVWDDTSLTYGELAVCAARLANLLAERGVRPGDFVALLLERGPKAIYALLAILQLGAAYVPIDPNYPQDRIEAMLRDCGTGYLLSEQQLDLAVAGVTLICLDAETLHQDPYTLPVWTHPLQAAYVMYTSGSTGKPKGVVIPRRAIVRLVRDTRYCDFAQTQTFMQAASLAFDASTFEIWGALLNGARLALLPGRSIEALPQLLHKYEVSCLWLTAQLFHLIMDEEPESLAGCGQVLAGGEALSPRHVRRFLERFPQQRLINGYGPTENTTFTCCAELRSTGLLPGGAPLGPPITRTSVYVTDHQLRLCPIGVFGELVTGGDGLAWGYLDQPGLTAKMFVPHPFSNRPGERLYRTGDLTRWLAHGETGLIEFAGRIDRQVKLRGFRIELGEIESALLDHDHIDQALVVLKRGQGQDYLVAYMVPASQQSLDQHQVRSVLAQRLPDYMMPSAFISIDAFPMTVNGKVDRKRLPDAQLANEKPDRGPADPVEEILVGIWAELLGLASTHVDANFFEMGGNSLLATRVVARIRRHLNVEVPLRAVFEHATPAQLACVLREARLGQDPRPPLDVSSQLCAPLSYSQSRLWFADQLEPGSGAYNIPLLLRLEGPLEITILKQALSLVFRRHEGPRTRFVLVDETPQQLIDPTLDLEVLLIDLAGLSADIRPVQAGRLLAREAARPFCLSSGPLMRALIIRNRVTTHQLMLNMHHIISDGRSLEVLLADLRALYTGLVQGQEPQLPHLPVQYRDFARWQHAWPKGYLDDLFSYWADTLADAPALLALPWDAPRPSHPRHLGRVHAFNFPGSLATALDLRCQASGSTRYMLLLAVYGAVLARYSGQSDICVGSPIANREYEALENTMGFFTNTLTLRLNYAANPTLIELLAEARQTCLAAYEHQDMPFEALVERLCLKRMPGVHPLFQTTFSLEYLETGLLQSGLPMGPLRVFLDEADQCSAKFDCSLFLFQEGENLMGRIEYSTELFYPETIRALCDNYVQFLEHWLAQPDLVFSQVELLDAATRQRLIHQWNPAERDYPRGDTIQTLIAGFAFNQPDALALLWEQETRTYQQWWQAATTLAAELRRCGIGPESFVAVCLPRSIELLVAILAIAQLGAIYQPLDENLPPERHKFMLEDSAAALLITRRDMTVLQITVARLFIEDPLEPAPDFHYYPGSPDNLAYIMFTSGSTGRPKGVGVTHRGVIRLVCGQSFLKLGPDERTFFLSSISFDASVFDIWSALLNGGSLAILRDGALDQIGRYVQKYRITTLFMTTQLFHLMVDEAPETLAHLRQMVTGGEALSRDHAERFLKARPLVPLFNAYGPTENGVITCCANLALLPFLSSGPPLGRPIDHTSVYVVDAHLNLQPPGVYGELVTGGDGLARGYLRRADLTAEKFVPDPFSGKLGARIYRTGDLVRWVRTGQDDAIIEFAGRIDRQVKLRGFRIELSEIESALQKCPQVAQSLVMLRTLHGEARLVAYLVPKAGEQIDPAEIHEETGKRLPAYMVPSVFVPLECFPLTANGKIDRGKLEVPELSEPEQELETLSGTSAELRELWSELLGISAIHSQDNFFSLGGHSLLATRLVARIRSRMRVEIGLQTVFLYPGLREMAAEIDNSRSRVLDSAPRSGQAATVCALSFAQSRLWFIEQLEPGMSTFNIPLLLRWRSALSARIFEQAFDLLTERHEALRTSFTLCDEEPMQRIEDPSSSSACLVDLRALPKELRLKVLGHLNRRFARRAFDLSKAPLIRWQLICCGPEDYYLQVAMHHIISDGWSTQILLREWEEAYAACLAERSPQWQPLPLNYRDYAVWQRDWLNGSVLEQQLRFWTGHLAGELTSLEMPTDWQRPSQQSYQGDMVSLAFPGQLWRRLQDLSRSRGATTFMTLLAMLVVLLRRYSAQSEFLVATPVANRSRSELEGLIGFFINTLILRTSLENDMPFSRVLTQVSANAQACFAHQDLPFERLVEVVKQERDMSRHPLAQVMFQVLEHTSFNPESQPSHFQLLDPPDTTAQLDLSFAVRETPADIILYLTYATSLFHKATAQRLLNHYLNLTEALIEAPDCSIDRVVFIGADERSFLLDTCNQTGSPFERQTCIHQLILAHADSERVALTHEYTQLDYRTLLGRAQATALRLRALGVLPDQPVGVCLHRNEDMIVALLAVLLAGGAYVPIDPAYPDDRKAYMLEDSGAHVVLTDVHEREHLTGRHQLVLPDKALCSDLVLPACTAENLAYIIYTSGSTGRPKGVAIQHLNAVALIHWAHRYFDEGEMACVLASTSICFDLSVFEIFATLTRGCQLILVENVLHLSSAPAAEQVTMINTVPSAMTELLHMGVPTSVTTVNLAGEPFQPGLINAIYKLPHVKSVHNLYGPSEDTTYSTGTRLPNDLTGIASIGAPILNTQVYLLDYLGALVPQGVPGEIYLGGAGVTRGYHARPRLTAEKYVPDGFGAELGMRLYRSGDLGRYRHDGALLFLGRIDHQVKIRGFRIELGEIEARLAQLADVEKTLVTTRPDRAGGPQLIAYVQPCKGVEALDESAMRVHLAAQLPEYMVPAAFVVLHFPLTPNGKIDRKRLPEPSLTVTQRPSNGVLSPTALRLSVIWRELLGIEVENLEDNFFQMGGHSLLATRAVSRMREQFSLEVPLKIMFQHPSLGALAAYLDTVAAEETAPLETSSFSETQPPLSFSQSRLWFIDQMEPGNPAYNIPLALHVSGPLNLLWFKQALDAICQRHEILRTCFCSGEQEPYQRVMDEMDLAFHLVDLSSLDPSTRLVLEPQLLQQAGLRPFVLDQCPLWRILLLRHAADDHSLQLTLHHIITDGWSLNVLMAELVGNYQAAAKGVADERPPLVMQYRDYVRWQRQFLAGGELERQLDFWRAHHAGELFVLDLPVDRARPKLQDFHGHQVQVTLSSRLRARLLSFGRERSVTPYMTLLSVLTALLHRYSGQETVLVGTPIAGRPRSEFEPMIGFFVNTLVPRYQPKGALSFEQLLAHVRETAIASFGQQELPFERLVEALQPERDLSRNPLFQIMFQYLQAERHDMTSADLQFEALEVTPSTCHFDMSLSVYERQNKLTVYLGYATALFDEASASRFLHHFQALAEALVAQPHLAIEAVDFMPPAERQLLLEELNRTSSPLDAPGLISEQFIASVARQRECEALVCGQKRWTYADLDRRARCFAQHLESLGLRPEEPVGVCMGRHEDMIAALLAVLLAGGCYVPLDPAYPEERKAYMLADSGARICMVDDETAISLPSHLELIFPEDADACSGDWQPAPLTPQQLAYIIYTSGSTGRPKGVAIEHGNACALFHWARNYFDAEDWQGVLASTSICFDLSVFEIFASLAMGAKLILVENLLFLPEAAAAGEVSMINTVPSAMTELLHLKGVPNSVRTVNLAGEPFQAALIRRIYDLPQIQAVHNLYGPSEDTTYSTAYTLPRDLEGMAPIGKPIQNTCLYLLDRKGRLSAQGLAGEIHLAGAGLTRGYFGRPGLTASRYIPNPFAAGGERLYRSGDLGRWRNDGELVFLGRIDHQVKLRGFRIELGEIEAEIARVAGVTKSLVLAPQEQGRTQGLLAFAQCEGPITAQLEEAIRARMSQTLPEYMVPSALVLLEQFPLTPNGKIDRQQLLALPIQGAEPTTGIVPRDEHERELCEIWKKVLGLETFGIHDNFFKLGGHSLMAVRVLSLVTQRFGVRLPLASFFQATTVAQLAALLRDHVAVGYQPLQRLRSGGEKTPLYLVHAVGGGLLGYAALVNALKHRPILGFQARGLDGDEPPMTSIEALATAYSDALMEQHGQGPVQLAGWSLGGVVATAMAERLRQAGYQVRPVLLFDSFAPVPQHERGASDELQALTYFIADMAGLNGRVVQMTAADYADLTDLKGRVLQEVAYQLALKRGVMGPELSLGDFKRLFRVFFANLQALENYQPKPQAGSVVLFRASENPQADGQQGAGNGWGQLFEEVIVVEVPGNHFSLLSQAALQQWIGQLEHNLV